MGAVHVVGAGLAGLSCAVGLALAGRKVSVYEAAGHAGGRCRSFFDPALGRRIDNGNHLILSGNDAALGYLGDIGSKDSLIGPQDAEFPFLDLDSGRRWTVRPNRGPVPWWIYSAARRVPASRPGDYLQGLRMAWAGPGATVADCLNTERESYKRFWEPLCVSILNTRAEEGAASLLWPVLRRTFGRGAAACRPLIAGEGLSESFVDPALKFLDERQCPVRFNCRLKAIDFAPDRVAGLDFGASRTGLAPADSVVLAVPPAAAAALVPAVKTPRGSRAIVNGHFLLPEPRQALSFLGLVGGLGQWLFVRGDVASLTVSAAGVLAEVANEEIARRLWADASRALDLAAVPLPAYRIVKEKRATFAQTPAEIPFRPGARTDKVNLFLAGDWTDTGLPATIEGAVLSGRIAADAVLAT